jgi:hypothetical protein
MLSSARRLAQLLRGHADTTIGHGKLDPADSVDELSRPQLDLTLLGELGLGSATFTRGSKARSSHRRTLDIHIQSDPDRFLAVGFAQPKFMAALHRGQQTWLEPSGRRYSQASGPISTSNGTALSRGPVTVNLSRYLQHLLGAFLRAQGHPGSYRASGLVLT